MHPHNLRTYQMEFFLIRPHFQEKDSLTVIVKRHHFGSNTQTMNLTLSIFQVNYKKGYVIPTN